MTRIEFGIGAGRDVIKLDNPDGANTGGTRDHINVYGVTPEQIWFARSGSDLVLKILETKDQMTFARYFDGDKFQFDQINAAGQSLDHTQITELMTKMNGNPNDGTSGSGITVSELSDELLGAIHQKWVAFEGYEIN